MSVISGTLLRIYDDTAALGYATSCSLDVSVETRETISKDSAGSWAENEAGKISATLSFEGFASEDQTINSNTVKSIEDIFTKVAAKTAVDWRFTTDATGEIEYSGSGYFTSFNISSPVEENATYSGTITVTGAITQGTVSA